MTKRKSKCNIARIWLFMLMAIFALSFRAKAQEQWSMSQIDSLIAHYKHTASKYLIKSQVLWHYVGIDQDGVHMYRSPSHKARKQPEFTVHWEDLEHFKNLIEYADRSYQIEVYQTKGTERFDSAMIQSINILTSNHQIIPVSHNKPLTGIKIAIDPGHIAGDFKMATSEDRFIEMYGVKGSTIRFFEGELTLTTGLILRDSLEALGAEVFMTREKGNYSAMGMHFQEWVETELVDAFLRKGYTLEQADRTISRSSTRHLYRNYFLDEDLNARADRINYFNPHFTVVIHFNADVENAGWFQPSPRNYSMVFVPGSYIGGELSDPIERFDFVRTLLTDHMQESALLSGFIVDEFENTLEVPTVSDYPIKPFYISRLSMEVQKGVYARNLRLCRLLNTPLCYGESLLQDNEKELLALKQNDLENGVIAPRLVTVAQAYLNGIKRYVEVLKRRQ